MSQLPAFVLEMLVCPRCRGRLIAEPHALRCDACRLRYPVRDGIPNLLVDEALPLPPSVTLKSGSVGEGGGDRRKIRT